MKIVILTNSCTTAITIAMKIAGVDPGAEVILHFGCIAGNQLILKKVFIQKYFCGR